MADEEFQITPLRRVCAGHWQSRDKRWTFLRHWSDPHPQRWYAYLGDDVYPLNDGLGHVKLGQVARFAEDQVAANMKILKKLLAGGMDFDDAWAQAEEVRVVGLDHRNVGDETRRILSQ
jgi:hypothetical protein